MSGRDWLFGLAIFAVAVGAPMAACVLIGCAFGWALAGSEGDKRK